MNNWFLNIVFILFVSFAFTQDTDEQLANYYFDNGDCEKAVPYLEKVYGQKPNEFIYNRYLSCLREVGNDKEILKLVEKQASNFPLSPMYQVAVGLELERQNDEKKAQKIYQGLINNLNGSAGNVLNLYKAFHDVGKYQTALEVLQKGDQLLKGSYPLNVQYAQVYGALNQTDKMIQEYINLLDHRPDMIYSLKSIIPRMIDFEDEDSERFVIFQNELIKKIQKNPKENVFSELLIWALVQRRNFPAALIQSKGLDKRTTNDGREVYIIGNNSLKNGDFSTARNAFKYIVELGEGKPYYYAAEQLLLNVRYVEITSKRNYTKQQILETIEEYKTTLSKMPKNGKAYPIMRELAFIQAYYANQSDEAIKLMNEALSYPRYNDLEEARNKLLLADVYVLQNEIWEASLLYMQVEKKFKFEPIGEEAKFKNARIFYYDGDFKFAQAQLDILKEATTRLIANDAINLSILITDNLGLDSNFRAMRLFAKADLLLEQHRYDEAFVLYDSIVTSFPTHNLMDDIFMRKAGALQNQGKWDEAIQLLLEIVEKYGDDILADDALFQIGQIYENHLFNNKKAAEYYFQLMRDYPGSLFVTEARKAYRSIN